MAKRGFQLRRVDEEALHEAFQECKDGPTRTRYQAVRLYGVGYSVQEIKRITGCSRSALMGWCRDYRERGVEGLLDDRNGGNAARLDEDQVQELARRLREISPRTFHHASGQQVAATETAATGWKVKELKAALHHWYGIRYRSRTSYYNLFKKCGFSYRQQEKRFVPVSSATR